MASAARAPGSPPSPGTRIVSSRAGGRVVPSERRRGGPSSMVAARQVRSTPRAPRAATASTRSRQSPSSAWWGLARATTTAAPADRSQPSSSARAITFWRSVSLRESRSPRKSATAASLARSGAWARPTSCAISVVTMRMQHRRGRRGPRAQAQLADGRVGDPQLHDLGGALARQHRALVLGRAAGHGQDAGAAVQDDHAGLQRVGRGAGDGGQPGAGLDRLRHLAEGVQDRARGSRLWLLGAAGMADKSTFGPERASALRPGLYA